MGFRATKMCGAMLLFLAWTATTAQADVHIGIGLNLVPPVLLPPPVYYGPPPAYYTPPPPVYYGPGVVYGEPDWEYGGDGWRDEHWHGERWRDHWHGHDGWREGH